MATSGATVPVPSPLDSNQLTFFWMFLVTTLLAVITTRLVTTVPQRQPPPSRRDAEVQCSLKTTLAKDLDHYTVEYIRPELRTYRAPLKVNRPGLIYRLILYRLHERQISCTTLVV